MSTLFNPSEAAHFFFDAYNKRAEYRKPPADISPDTVADAYAVQDELAGLFIERQGDVAGFKIATTTKVMQKLLNIDSPCAGKIFQHRVHNSPGHIAVSDYVNAGIECELAIRLGSGLPKSSVPYTAETVSPAVAEIMPAFELIEDRKADYNSTNARLLIAENCWNAGVVLGRPVQFRSREALVGIEADLEINGVPSYQGATEDPLAALAWVANLAVERSSPLQAGMIVITGSVIPTLVSVNPGDSFRFTLRTLGTVELKAD